MTSIMTPKPYPTDQDIGLLSPMSMKRGPAIKNRFVLAPMTTTQSAQDGTLLSDEYRWLVKRAQGGFGMVTTCASHVQPNGQGFPGQLGCFDDVHVVGLRRLADGLREAGTVSSLQLHHAGMRAEGMVADKVGASEDVSTGTRSLSSDEVEQLIEDFVKAATRAERAGFDGVQIHGGHGYIITQFLSPEINKRTDHWGGSLENRSRLLLGIIHAIRQACGPQFQIGVRISPERFGLQLAEMIALAQVLLNSDIEYLDLSIWDVTKEPEETAYRGQTLASHFIALDRGPTRLGLAGKLMSGPDAQNCLTMGADYAAIGKAGILAHDFPAQIADDPKFSTHLPTTVAHLEQQGVGSAFIGYLKGFPGLVSDA